ncbi:MAG: hypothetical protein IKX47_06480 [Oscillospiraceae bacterium]|nr:hypothetical protein [Oscillospiraceae bacterium]
MKKGIALILAILLCLSLLAGCGSKTAKIDLTDYMNVLFRGKDGEGTARADFDYSGFEKAVMAAAGDGDSILPKLVQFESALEITVSPEKGLKNGDEVTLTAVYGKDAAKALGITVGSVSKKVTVEGLSGGSAAPATEAPAVTETPAPASTGNLTPEATEEPGAKDGLLDPFDPACWNKEDGIEIRYTGSSPYGWLEAVSHLPDDDPLNHVYYRFSEEQNIHEGDKVTVTAYLTGVSSDEYTLKRTECEFVVGPVRHYLMDVAELGQDTAAELKRQAEGLAKAFAAGTLEFQDKGGWTGFYNGETVTVNSCSAGDTVYAVRCQDGFIQALLLPCSMNVTVEEPESMDDPQTYEYDLLVLCAADGLLVEANGDSDFNRPTLVQKGVPDLEDQLVQDQLTWYDNANLETAKLPG